MIPIHKIGDVAFAVVIVAGILVLTRPGSQGPNIVRGVTAGFANVITSATGGGSYHRKRR